jgi:glucose dehydrogenase
MLDWTESGVLTTASDLLFTRSREANFLALDARNGALLWKVRLGGNRGQRSGNLPCEWPPIRRGLRG